MKLLKDFHAAKMKVYEYFGYESWGDPEDHTDAKWTVNDHEISWGVEKPGYYVEETLEVFRKKEYTMVLARANGDRVLLVFDNAKEVPEDK